MLLPAIKRPRAVDLIEVKEKKHVKYLFDGLSLTSFVPFFRPKSFFLCKMVKEGSQNNRPPKNRA